MYYPGFKEFEKLCKRGNLIPVYREVLADLETPVSAFIKLQDGLEKKWEGYAYLLESVERGEKLGRYSFIGIDPFMVFQSKSCKVFLISSGKKKVFQVKDDPLFVLKKIMQNFKVQGFSSLPVFFGGGVGYIGYDTVRFWEKISSQDKEDDGFSFPDLLFVFTKSVVIFDHIDHKIKIISFAFLEDSSPEKAYQKAKERIDSIVSRLKKKLKINRNFPEENPGEENVISNFAKDKFMEAVEKAKEHIRAGDIFQVVLSQRFRRKIYSSPFNIYRVLRSLNPSPYMYFLRLGDFSIVGSSPEVMVRKEGENVLLRPIAGTRPRGKNEEEDLLLMQELLNDEKEKAEHLMLVDLGRNDLGRVCEYGKVKAGRLFSLEKYSHVMHLVSEIKGKLRRGFDQFDLLRACFPAGTVSGAPKIRAMQIIEELEPSRRGPYAGALGYISFSGNMDTCIIIRTVIVKDSVAYIQAGAGIVADSLPEREYQETLNKAKALIEAISLSERKKEWLL